MATVRAVRTARPRVLVAGGGVAAIEALLALRELAGPRASLQLLAPEREALLRPTSVAEPFGLGGPAPVALEDVARHCGAHLHRGALAGVRPAERLALTDAGEALSYDHLVVAVGARDIAPPPGTIPFRGPRDVPALQRLLDDAERGALASLAFAVPAAAGWTLPAYELALMTAVDLRARGAATTVRVVTVERAPLWLFGDAAGDALAALLAERGIELVHAKPGPGDADAVVVLPPLEGPALEGLPSDDRGFLPVDAHGRVAGAPGVWAAGDATAFPVKQGGLACQQADAVAAAIAAEIGGQGPAEPFRPVLRGLLLTGGAPLYLRAELDAAGAGRRRTAARLHGEISTRALWWPPGKVAGRFLAPFLATARPMALGRQPLADRTAAATPPAADRNDALELALLLADADAAAGDHAQALHALDAAAALSGGVLPVELARRRDMWRATRVAAPVPYTEEES